MKSGGYSRNPFFYALFFGLIPALALSVYRSFYGFDWSDETYYAALSFRFLLGDSIFLNSWDIHQTSSIISLPLIALYRYIVGNTDGILLYLRLCYVMLTGFIAFYALYVFEAKGAILSAAVSACLIVLFVPHNIGAMSYNTLSLQLMFLSWMMIIDDRKRLKNIRLILSGVFFALSVQCYPYLILVLPVYLVWYFFITPSKRNCSIGLNAHYAWMIGVLITCSSFALFIHITSRVNLRELLPTIGYLLTDPEHLNKNYIVSISEYFSSLAGFIGIPGFIICLLSLLSMFLYIPKKT